MLGEDLASKFLTAKIETTKDEVFAEIDRHENGATLHLSVGTIHFWCLGAELNASGIGIYFSCTACISPRRGCLFCRMCSAYIFPLALLPLVILAILVILVSDRLISHGIASGDARVTDYRCETPQGTLVFS